MNKIVIFIGIAIVNQLSNIGLALDCKTAPPALYFGNGMFNSADQADISRSALERFLQERHLIESEEEVGLAYNFSESVAEQLLQVTTQKDEESGRSFFRWISSLSSAPEFF